MKFLLLLLVLCIGSSVYAFHVKWGKTVIISKPLYEDLYVSGGTVIINAPVYGDVIVAGGTVNINDRIQNDLFLAGGTVKINGYIGDDIRCAGGELTILQNVGGDLVVAGGRVTVANDVMIYGGLMANGGELTLNGSVQGGIKISGGKVVFNGTAVNDFAAKSETLVMNGVVRGHSSLAARSIDIGPEAAFYNDVRYWTKKGEIDFYQSTKAGAASFDSSLKIEQNEWYYLGRGSVLGLTWYLGTVFLFILLIQYLFSKTLKKAADSVSQSAAKSLLWGLLFFLGVPLAIIILLVSIIGIPIGLILIFSYVGIIILATLTAALVIANWYNTKFHANWGYGQIVGSAFVLFILFKMISFTPLFGWLMMMVIAFVSIGSILLNINWRRHQVAV